MRAVIQRVSKASVTVYDELNKEEFLQGRVTGEINKGLAVLLGVMDGDTEREAELLAKKLCELRIFTDENNKMNLSVSDVLGGILIISQFTLGADCSHGRRPSFIKAARPEIANNLYEYFVSCVRERFSGLVQTGVFGANMEFRLINDGPVTIVFDTDEWSNKA